jgi:DNA-binding transcriptional regulator YiaG
MANIASLLKSEISRVARREVRAETAGLKKSASSHRSDIAALKRRVLALESEVRRLRKASGAATAAAAGPDAPERVQRFSPKGLASQRKRLGLSAQECGLLVGASGQSIYNWEDGKARPRAKHLQALAALRGMGKKDAAARLSELRGA